MGTVASAPSRPRDRTIAIGVAGLVGTVVAIGAVYLWAYATGRFATPIGFDTPQVIWRANLVGESGLGSLVGWAPADLTVHGDRTGALVFASILDGVFGIEPYRLMFTLPAIASMLVALAAGGFAIDALEEPPWAFGVYAIGVGASTHMARIAVGSHDNAFVMGMLVAFALTALLATAGRPAIVGSIVLFAGAVLAHWRFAALFLPLFVTLSIVLLPGSWRRWKEGASFASTPSARLGSVVTGGAVAGAASILLAPESPLRGFDVSIRIDPERLAAKSTSRLTPLRLPVTVAAAVVGAVISWWPSTPLRRWAVITMVLWAGSVLVAAGAYHWLDQPVPIYRVAAYSLGIPMLAMASVVWVGRFLVGRLGAPGAAIAAVVVTGALAWSIASAGSVWHEETPIMSEDKVVAMSDASAYLDASGNDGPVIFLTSTPRLIPTLRQVYAGVPPQLITRTRIFMGTLPDLLARRPTTVQSLEEESRSTLAGALEVADDEPVIVYLDVFNPRLDAPTGALEVAPGVRVAATPGASADGLRPAASRPLADVTPWSLAWVASVGLALSFVVGLGWSWALVPTTWLGRLSVAPAFGAAILTLVGTMADRLGVAFTGSGSLAIVLVSAMSGWLVVVAGTRTRTDPGPG